MGDRKHDIERYLRGELSGEEMHALEKEALNDPFLAEALEGIEQAGPDNFLYDLHTIRRSVHDRVRNNPRKKNKVIRIWAWTGAIAATLLLIAVSGFIVLRLIREQALRQQAMEAEAEQIPAEFLEKDTLVIALPAHAAVPGKTDRSPSMPTTRMADQSPEQSPPLIAETDDDSTPEGLPGEAELEIAEETDESRRQSQALTESIAKADNVDVQLPSIKDTAIDNAPVSRASKELKRQVAGTERSTQLSPSTARGIVLKGRVLDAHGEALPGVNVVIKGANIGTVTNADGEYELSVPPGYSNLVFAFIGFESQEVAIDGRQQVNVSLNEDVTSLSEVVVVSGYGFSSGSTVEKSAFRAAEPVEGRADFKRYLETAVKYPAEAVANKVEGRVTVRFTVEANGQLTNFEVIKGIGSGTEDALITAIKEGSKWKPGMQGDKPVADKVKVRYRFQLPQ